MDLRSSRIEEFVGDASYPLELKIGELRLLQAALNSGPTAILDRLQNGAWFVDDIIEPIRLGLIGGGMPHRDAHDLVSRYVVAAYLLQYLPVAIKVLVSSLIGDVDDPPEEMPGELQAPMTLEN